MPFNMMLNTPFTYILAYMSGPKQLGCSPGDSNIVKVPTAFQSFKDVYPRF